MFAKLAKKYRALTKDVDEAFERYSTALYAAKTHEDVAAARAELDAVFPPAREKIEVFESFRLVEEAHKLGIEIPDTDKWWNIELVDGGTGSRRTHLSEFGRVKVAKLIREEKLIRAEQWIKLIAPIITALTGLVGTIIGLLAFLWSIRK